MTNIETSDWVASYYLNTLWMRHGESTDQGFGPSLLVQLQLSALSCRCITPQHNTNPNTTLIPLLVASGCDCGCRVGASAFPALHRKPRPTSYIPAGQLIRLTADGKFCCELCTYNTLMRINITNWEISFVTKFIYMKRSKQTSIDFSLYC